MKTRLLFLPLAWGLLVAPLAAQEAQESDLDALREEIRSMRAEYESRIADLESRLDAAERAAADAGARVAEAAAAAAAEPPADYSAPPMQSPQTVSVARDTSFNPAIGVTFQGQAWSWDHDPEDYLIPGFPLGGEAGPAPEG
ncbi:MAG TPA: hypothetical protein VFG48_13500, partial [Xanthomonadales bacterium]|nr:hypothetical protein [Xanthomonadales bacterium]